MACNQTLRDTKLSFLFCKLVSDIARFQWKAQFFDTMKKSGKSAIYIIERWRSTQTWENLDFNIKAQGQRFFLQNRFFRFFQFRRLMSVRGNRFWWAPGKTFSERLQLSSHWRCTAGFFENMFLLTCIYRSYLENGLSLYWVNEETELMHTWFAYTESTPKSYKFFDKWFILVLSQWGNWVNA